MIRLQMGTDLALPNMKMLKLMRDFLKLVSSRWLIAGEFIFVADVRRSRWTIKGYFLSILDEETTPRMAKVMSEITLGQWKLAVCKFPLSIPRLESQCREAWKRCRRHLNAEMQRWSLQIWPHPTVKSSRIMREQFFTVIQRDINIWALRFPSIGFGYRMYISWSLANSAPKGSGGQATTTLCNDSFKLQGSSASSACNLLEVNG
jgi:hypothetical protein